MLWKEALEINANSTVAFANQARRIITGSTSRRRNIVDAHFLLVKRKERGWKQSHRLCERQIEFEQNKLSVAASESTDIENQCGEIFHFESSDWSV